MDSSHVEWRYFVEKEKHPDLCDALDVFAHETLHIDDDHCKSRCDVYVPVSKSVGIKYRKQAKIELKCREHCFEEGCAVGLFEVYRKIVFGKDKTLDDAMIELRKNGILTPDIERRISSDVQVDILKKIGKCFVEDCISVEISDLLVASSNHSSVQKEWLTCCVEGPKNRVVKYITENIDGCKLHQIARSSKDVILGGYPIFTLKISER